VICVLGPPGSGKTATSTALGVELDANVVHGGHLLRAAAGQANDATLAKQAHEIMAAAQPIPVDLYCRLARGSISRGGRWLVLDGYPRDAGQFRGLPEVCRVAGISTPSIVGVFLNVASRELRQRIGSRRLCANCHTAWDTKNRCCDRPSPCTRTDDADPALVAKRMEFYSAHESLLRQQFEHAYRQVSVSAVAAPEVVAREIANFLFTSRSRVSDVHTFPQRADSPPPRVVE
jgi:adenylate kinase family enzyme